MAEQDGPERTADGRYIVVNGRRWRASDPAIPEKLRAELVAELMAARRAVKDEPESARPRVQDAKTALGERGRAWWESSSSEQQTPRIEATIRTLLRHRDGGTTCPSDVARCVGGDEWRDLMPHVREVAWSMADAGELQVVQKGEPVRRGVRGRSGSDCPDEQGYWRSASCASRSSEAWSCSGPVRRARAIRHSSVRSVQS